MNYRRPTKMAEKGRTCEAKGCRVILSVYNMTAICSACFENIPVRERRYLYRDGF
jgi:hypothetical protein